MFAKIKIAAVLEVVTGLHIGDNTGYAPIGALDNPVIRDSYSGDPYIPGSSLKGKMRSLLVKAALPEGRYILPKCENDPENICRLFGTPGNNTIDPKTARLQFSDAFLVNRDQLLHTSGITEVKAENFITRATSVANPRSTERVVRGAQFGVTWFYTMEDDKQILEDLQTLSDGCKLLSMDYLGGSGTRGYGRIGFHNFAVNVLYGDLPQNIDVPALEAIFKDVTDYAVQDV